MRIIAVEDDEISRLRLEAGLRAAKRNAIITSNGPDALREIDRDGEPIVLLLDWAMPGMDGAEVCRQVRRTTSRPVYVIFMTAYARHERFLEALEAGADDFLPKPFTIEALLARIRLGERVLRAVASSEFLFEEALAEGLRSSGGVVVTRVGGQVGRVFVSGGDIVWAHVRGEPSGLDDVLGGRSTLSPEDTAAVLEEAKRSQRHFADVLVEWKLLDDGIVRAALRDYLSARLTQMSGWTGARAMFVPEQRGFSGAFAFAPNEVLAALKPARTLFPPAEQGRPLERLTGFTAARAIDGAITACVVHAPSGGISSLLGEEPEPDVLRALLALVNVAGPAGGEEAALTVRERYHLLLRPQQEGDRCLYACLPRGSTNLAMARLQMASVARVLPSE